MCLAKYHDVPLEDLNAILRPAPFNHALSLVAWLDWEGPEIKCDVKQQILTLYASRLPENLKEKTYIDCGEVVWDRLVGLYFYTTNGDCFSDEDMPRYELEPGYFYPDLAHIVNGQIKHPVDNARPFVHTRRWIFEVATLDPMRVVMDSGLVDPERIKDQLRADFAKVSESKNLRHYRHYPKPITA
ncbi:hypothetical protein [Parahaliea mediterranea]|uniref:hypothetical protein n=1 Tax=Parahaliea mediterranea TaxID=651086 RepID=UPI000E2FC187|nr:hypothetical protein [Parahaliea mediterranea]